MIIPIHAANPGTLTGSGNWTYLVTGPAPLLVDAGVGHRQHVDAIAARLPRGPGRVVVTHAHPDHIAGVTAIAARWPQTRFLKLPWPDRDAGYAVAWTALGDGDIIEAGADSLEVVHTPGHAPDHICLWQAASRILFCGDLMVKGSTVVIPASSGGSLAHYLRSLERVDALDPRQLLPAHGEVIDEPRDLIQSYKAHRAERERQVLAVLAAGPAPVETIAARIYRGLAPPLMAMARESVLAHLDHLQATGMVERVRGLWSARPSAE